MLDKAYDPKARVKENLIGSLSRTLFPFKGILTIGTHETQLFGFFLF